MRQWSRAKDGSGAESLLVDVGKPELAGGDKRELAVGGKPELTDHAEPKVEDAGKPDPDVDSDLDSERKCVWTVSKDYA